MAEIVVRCVPSSFVASSFLALVVFLDVCCLLVVRLSLGLGRAFVLCPLVSQRRKRNNIRMATAFENLSVRRHRARTWRPSSGLRPGGILNKGVDVSLPSSMQTANWVRKTFLQTSLEY